MSHRTDIRQGVVARLQGKTAAGTRVYASRSRPLDASLLPALAVFTGDERMESLGGGAPIFRHELDIVVAAFVAGEDDYDAEADTLAETVVAVLMTAADWVATFEKVLGIEIRPTHRDEGETPMAGREIAITVQYSSEYPPVLADALITIHADWDLPPHGNVQPPLPAQAADAEDEVTLPQ